MTNPRAALAVRFPANETHVRKWLSEEHERTGESVNALIRRAVRELMERTRTMEDPVVTTAPPRPADPLGDPPPLPPELLAGFGAGQPAEPPARADLRPPENGCQKTAAVGDSDYLLRCWWRPEDHPGDVHFDARERLEWRPSAISPEEADEMLRPPPQSCISCGQRDPAAQWAPLFGGVMCDSCTLEWGRMVASMSPAARNRMLGDLIEQADSGRLTFRPARVPGYLPAPPPARLHEPYDEPGIRA